MNGGQEISGRRFIGYAREKQVYNYMAVPHQIYSRQLMNNQVPPNAIIAFI